MKNSIFHYTYAQKIDILLNFIFELEKSMILCYNEEKRRESMKTASLKKVAAAVREDLVSRFGSASSSASFESFFRGAVRCYMIENGYSQMIGDISEILFSGAEDEQDVEAASRCVTELLTTIPHELWNRNVQLIGQLYQYYNSEQKDAVMSGLKNNTKVHAECMAAVTQIFTPDWIARYMTENTLGRAFAAGCGFDTSGLDYYIERGYVSRGRSPEEIRLLDPCAGSGNILVCAFDMFMKLYLSAGFSEEDAARLTIKKNLFGLDIDSRICRIARFALLMRAAEHLPAYELKKTEPQVYDMEELYAENDGFSEQFYGSEVFGSLIRPVIPPSKPDTKAARVYKILSARYSAVVTNPPYMACNNMNSELLGFIRDNYSDVRADLFSAFIVRCCELAEQDGYIGLLTPYVWMFIQSYEKLRQMIFSEKTLETLVQFEYSSFDGATVPVCAFTLYNSYTDVRGAYFRLTDFRGGQEVQRQKLLEAVSDRKCGYYYEASASDFSMIPGSPAAYWVSGRVRRIYAEYPPLGSISAPRKGNSTSDNDRFLRLWYEVDKHGMNLGSCCIDRNKTRSKRWFPYNKGGGYRKWYGFNDYVIDWYDDAAAIRAIPTAVIANYQYFTKPGLTWSTLTSGKFSIRQFGDGYIFDNGGCCIFELGGKKNFICGLLNSKVFAYIFGQLNPTLNFQSGEVAKFPFIYKHSDETDRLVDECTLISEEEYDSFETSRNFKRHPLV